MQKGCDYGVPFFQSIGLDKQWQLGFLGIPKSRNKSPQPIEINDI